MARKKKVTVEKIETNYTAIDLTKKEPKCLHNKCEYCKAEICGEEWFSICQPSTNL